MVAILSRGDELINVDFGNGLLPDGTMPLPESMFIWAPYHSAELNLFDITIKSGVMIHRVSPK